MKLKQSIFAVFQQGDEYFEILNDPVTSNKVLIRQIIIRLLFSFAYGLIMGSYNGFLQSLVTGIKIPALIFLSLSVCFPALFVIQFTIGSKMSVSQMANMILSGMIVFSTIALSFSPIIFFFMVTSNNYEFIKLLHVAIFIFAGVFGVKTIISGLKYSCEKKNIYPKVGMSVIKFWMIIFAFVSVQLAWNLRPFVGSKDLPFEVFRKKEGNFYIAIIQSVGNIINPSWDNVDKDDTNQESSKAVSKDATNDSLELLVPEDSVKHESLQRDE